MEHIEKTIEQINRSSKLQGLIKVWKADEKGESFLAMDRYIHKSALDVCIRDWKEEGRKIEGTFYLNGNVEVKIYPNSITDDEIFIDFKVQPIEVIIPTDLKI